MKKLIFLLSVALICFAFIRLDEKAADKPEHIPASKQRNGNAEKGFAYLITGDYIKSGIPYSLFMLATKKDTNNFLNRSGNNKKLSHDLTAINAPNGELIVAPNCLQCHAQIMDGKLILGLGNSLSDFTKSQEPSAKFADKFLKHLTGDQAKKYEAAKNFITALKMVAPNLVLPTKGLNVADELAALLASHRDPETLTWSDKTLLSLPDGIVPTDVPAWWLLKKKNAMFYNGFGRGDFSRFLMASNLLTVTDTAEAKDVDNHFPDVLAYINSITPPKYPKAIDQTLADKGNVIFNGHCSRCHGTYGASENYPNLLIPESIIQTDPLLYSSNYSNPQFVTWFNKSWFTSGQYAAKLVPYRGYIAPPLDGIWITAPYLHNGSVPDLETLLNSKKRPIYWKRNFKKPEYNYDSPGWIYEKTNAATDNETYNTTLRGYGNGGHNFGDKLSATERKSVIEYLKTL
ncbi:MAG: hypothetical protein ABJA78_13100 [Ferruginibacter sp.]